MQDRTKWPKSPFKWLDTLLDQTRIRLQYGPEFIGDSESIEVGLTPHHVAYQEGPQRLLHYPAQGPKQATPLLLVYSLINRPYIFDLRPKRSLIEFLVQQGHEVFLLDWGDPTPEMGQRTLSEMVMGTLRRCVKVIQRQQSVEAIHLLGYCMGASFATLYAAYRPQDIARMVLLTPMLGNDGGLLQQVSSHQRFTPDLMTGQLIDGRRLKLFFSAIKPAASIKKERDFWQNYDSESFMEHFLPVEKWSNDTPNLPGKAFQQVIELTVRQDALKQGKILLEGKSLDFGQIKCPVLAVATQHDWIIPVRALETTGQVLSQADYTPYLLKGGHIGLVVGRSAGILWQDLHRFLQGEKLQSPVALPADMA